ncbi:NAD-binding protein [Lentinula edodes]|uniref:NAD-binding protein n=1 Tax=Lentinula edodes TaxID=5353 RepID=A0A1Q3EJ46_LENED|nr:NAD-binding protein [Lentinula edodes]
MTSRSLTRGATRVALITGAAQGIGKAIALRLASDGFKIALNDVDSKRNQLEGVNDEIEKDYGCETCSVPGDVSKERDVEDMVQVVSQRLGSLDVMVANAGILGSYTPILSTTEKQWDDVLRINTKGIFFCYKYAAKQMVAQGRPGGRIIGASSFAGKQGLTHIGAYAASKFAVRGLTQVAALELGHHGITVNAYAPGAIETPLATAIDLSTTPAGKDFLNKLPSFSTVGKPEEVASLVSFLASQESGYITGQTISVNGGLFFD